MNGSNASIVRAIRGPLILITVGVLFVLNNFTWFQFDKSWPILLIVIGLLSILKRGVEPPRPVAPPPPPPPPPPYPGATYTQSPYAGQAPAAGPAKGGFGSSAPPRSAPDAPPPPPVTPEGGTQ
jgi:hypothetical protein